MRASPYAKSPFTTNARLDCGEKGERPNILRSNLESGDVGEIRGLRKTGIKIRVSEKLILISQAIRQRENLACGAEHQLSLFVDFVENWH
jgi:hypothetical protein